MSQVDYDIIVVGGGHAGAEAAWAAANLLRAEYDASAGQTGRVAMVTMDAAKIGQMSCNPAIGGLAKGQMVREIDALGGLMGLAIDATGIQFRILNQSKGPAVRGPRAQADKYAYAREVQRLLRSRANLDIIEGTVDELIVEHGRCTGAVVSRSNIERGTSNIAAGAVVLTTGTFMRGLMHTGPRQTPGGRVGEQAAVGISVGLQQLGLELGRLKTGTPPRLAAESINFDVLDIQPGDENPQPFSELTSEGFPPMPQRVCWTTKTRGAIHDQIRANLDRAPMYNGQIETAGPRYCPSIEDKVMRFADKTSHTVFLEPESLQTNEIYCNGISTSLPDDVQDFMVHHLPGCEHAKILRYGYAVEYDMVWPHQIDATMMVKMIEGLLLAGQINGTSGYEEAAGQGLLAGLNAVRYARGEFLVRFGRDESYIGVMMDDLVTKTPREPYRMFTSRAEHRLLLRADNAADRRTPMGRGWGLVDEDRWANFQQRRAALDALREHGGSVRIGNKTMLDWMRQPEVAEADVLEQLDGVLPAAARSGRILTTALSDAKYSGFIERHRRQHERLADLEHQLLPPRIDYTRITGLRNEAKLTLDRFRPATVGQAGRLAGITPADLNVLAIALKRATLLTRDP